MIYCDCYRVALLRDCEARTVAMSQTKNSSQIIDKNVWNQNMNNNIPSVVDEKYPIKTISNEKYNEEEDNTTSAINELHTTSQYGMWSSGKNIKGDIDEISVRGSDINSYTSFSQTKSVSKEENYDTDFPVTTSVSNSNSYQNLFVNDPFSATSILCSSASEAALSMGNSSHACVEKVIPTTSIWTQSVDPSIQSTRKLLDMIDDSALDW